MTEGVPPAEGPVTELRGVGPRKAELLARLGITRVQDLLFHLPLHYQDRTRVMPIAALRHGMHVVLEVQVELAEVRYGRRRSLLCRVSDGTGSLFLRFFHFSARQKEGLVRGTRLRCFGEARGGPYGLEMVHPEYDVLKEGESPALEEVLTPVYPATEGLQQAGLRALCDQALETLDTGGLPDWIPQEIIQDLGLPGLEEALRFLHRPPPDVVLERLEGGAHPAQRRLVFEELLAHQISLRQLRARMREQRARVLNPPGEWVDRLLGGLPFSLTGAQQRVIAEVAADLACPRPMLRLVQGDVGSGKTIVAAAAALTAVEAGCQVAVMAPTDLLAEQHLRSFRGWLEPLGLEVGWLTARVRAAERRTALEALASGETRVVVGTHALFQESVRFKDLGLVVVDEQHRFGVHQRLALREKGTEEGCSPHQLIMTATPIPRTLEMTAYADLDCSVIDELPPGRTPATTVAVADARREEVIQRVREALAGGRQAYWVCTLIEESEALQCENAGATAVRLAEALPQARVGLVHGRLKPAEKEAAMAAFMAGDTNLLVATTVIEVGVDIANASLMIIENAERLGLSQLHQLRGRVGRGAAQSHCVLMYHGPLSQAARTRLAAMRETHDGFEIARRDLELRGPGEVLGTRQTGLAQFRIADLVRDESLFPQLREVADQILRDHPERADPLVCRWLGESARYGQV